MDRRIGRSAALLAVAAALMASGCSPQDLLGIPGLDEHTPVWITASWTGGATGAPNDRTDREPAEFFGSLCPASSVDLQNQSGGFAGITIVNGCTILVTYYLCATKGAAPPQPQFGLDECAQDPFDTPLSQLHGIPLNPGADYVNATAELSIQVFYCSDEAQMFTSPLRCVG